MIKIPQNLAGKELFAFLKANKQAIVAQKKALPKCSDAVTFAPSFLAKKDGIVSKADIGEIPETATSVHVKVVANTALWCDSQKDVLLRDSASKSIKEGGGRYHLHDHIHRLDEQVGDVTDIYYQDVALTELGISLPGNAQALIYESDVKKTYSPRIFELYKSGKIKQHSIGLLYIRIELAINDEDYEKEMDFWNKYAPLVINQEAIEDGYFWVIQEYRLLENSCVLFGSNILTPTLDVKDTGVLPLESTEIPPSPKAFDVSDALKKTIFII